jgi:hypothetical protein
MGRIPAGIMGGVKGKVGGIIGASWKGINYIKTYVIPANPQSEAQQGQRSKMQLVVQAGKLILTAVIQPFWNYKASQMAGFHLYTSVNLKLVDDETDYENLLVTQGSLEGFTSGDPAAGSYNSGNGQATITWDETISGNGLLTDNIGIAIIDFNNNVAFTSIGTYTRDDESAVLSIGTGRNTAYVRAYLFAYRGSIPDLVVSDSECLPWSL